MKLLHTAPYLLTELPNKALRPVGLHLSDIIQDLGQGIGELAKRKSSGPDRRLSYFDLGFTWEGVLEEEFKRRQLVRLAPMVELQLPLLGEGIHMTPDGLWRGKPKRLLESKLTFAHPPREAESLLAAKWAWRVQTQCYCHNLGVAEVQFIVCWVGYVPDPIEYVFQYTKAEMAKTWSMVLKHRDHMLRRGDTLAANQ